MPADLRTDIRELHRPVQPDDPVASYLACGGCPPRDARREPQPWPCATARLVYTAPEIAAHEAVFRARFDVERQASHRRVETKSGGLAPAVRSLLTGFGPRPV